MRKRHARIGTSTAPSRYRRNGLGVAALCLGIAGCIVGLVPVTGLVAIVLGIVGVGLAVAGHRRLSQGDADNRVTTWTGLALSTAAIFLGFVGVVIMNDLLEDTAGSSDVVVMRGQGGWHDGRSDVVATPRCNGVPPRS